MRRKLGEQGKSTQRAYIFSTPSSVYLLDCEVLQQALKSDPRNIYTLNNMGVAKEMEGENQEALKYYDEAAVAAQPNATAVVTTNSSWRGRPLKASRHCCKHAVGRTPLSKKPSTRSPRPVPMHRG